jgi:hypothetical protein
MQRWADNGVVMILELAIFHKKLPGASKQQTEACFSVGCSMHPLQQKLAIRIFASGIFAIEEYG